MFYSFVAVVAESAQFCFGLFNCVFVQVGIVLAVATSKVYGFGCFVDDHVWVVLLFPNWKDVVAVADGVRTGPSVGELIEHGIAQCGVEFCFGFNVQQVSGWCEFGEVVQVGNAWLEIH